MTPIAPVVRTMTFNEQVKYGLCNRGLMMETDRYAYRLTAGTTDSVWVFEQGTILFVLTLNHQFCYVALDWYQGSEDEPVDSFFLQGDYAVSECVGRDWRDIPELDLARRLSLLFA